jgi:hypothetical protein
MRTTILTLIDITKTDAKRDGDQKAYSQQSNFNTLLQTASLRANLVPIKTEQRLGMTSQLGFGSKVKGKQRYWAIVFDDERDTEITQEMFQEDFDLVPVITGLGESVKFEDSVFYAKDEVNKNIVFKINEI